LTSSFFWERQSVKTRGLTELHFAPTEIGFHFIEPCGYIREQGMEQYVRDCRITQIYEGTNGVQALDLVGRKLPARTVLDRLVSVRYDRGTDARGCLPTCGHPTLDEIPTVIVRNGLAAGGSRI
jgi:hypothetical protein